jgi:enoyl-CoA hydratase/carnithine racemase
VVTEALEAADRIASLAPIAVRQAKHAMRAGLHRDLASAMQLEIDAYNLLVGTEDRKEGLRAFNEKRKPEFKGR